ncbi:MAG: ATP-binding cassette domain-containing protein, partial [Betaproteobacteria bacterium]|nr:ATP-binding cassette domain-containing protein [Betaproteobacteria bacterium]
MGSRERLAGRGAAVRVDRVAKSYGAVRAVQQVSIGVAAGEFVSLLGPSGSGKTTLLMMIAGFETPDAGTLHIGDRDVTQAEPNERNLGMVFQRYALFPHLTVADNIAFPLKMRKLARADIAHKVEAAL